MKTTTEKPTPGYWTRSATKPHQVVGFNTRSNMWMLIAEFVASKSISHYQAQANADFAIEAGTVYHETGLTPREILAQRDEFAGVLQNIMEALDLSNPDSYAADDSEGSIDYAYQCAKTALERVIGDIPSKEGQS